MKFLILLRHGIAEARTADKADDDRELTDEGRRRIKRVASALTRAFPAAEALYSSPLVRCKQTAEVVAKAYGGALEVTTTDALRPEADPDEFRSLLDKSGVEFAIFVGHEPNLSEIMLALTNMRGEVELKKGGCYGIRFEDGSARLEWMLPPRILRA
jgi:phosphohistidine phosphatase